MQPTKLSRHRKSAEEINKAENRTGGRKKKLSEYQVIKPGVGEKILLVQRRHEIALFNFISQQILLLFVLLIAIMLTSIFLSDTFSIFGNNDVLTIYMILFITCSVSISIIYSYLYWYYELFVVTNKAIIHRFCFRLSGPYSDRVYGAKMNIREVVRRPPNLIYDLLKIQDVLVYFRKIDQEHPFIFKTPKNAQEIAELINNLATTNLRKQSKNQI